MSAEYSIDTSIHDMPNLFTIKPFIVAHLAEVKGMLLTEYDEKETMELFREEGKAEGLAEGKAEGLAEGLAKGLEQSFFHTIASYRDCGIVDEEIIKKVMARFHMTEGQSREYVKRFDASNL